jgi:transposase-like protein
MPWREICSLDEKMRLMAALAAEEESVSELCEDFGISRKTAYKWWRRYLGVRPGGTEGAFARAAGGAMGDKRGPSRGDHRTAPGASELGAKEVARQT